MLIKKADVKNHLAAKLRKRRLLQGSTTGLPAELSSGANGRTLAVASENLQEPLSPASEFALPIRLLSRH